MTKFEIGDAVTVCPNLASFTSSDHCEADWDGSVTSVHVNLGRQIVSYGVTPIDGGLPRNVLEYRLTRRNPAQSGADAS